MVIQQSLDRARIVRTPRGPANEAWLVYVLLKVSGMYTLKYIHEDGSMQARPVDETLQTTGWYVFRDQAERASQAAGMTVADSYFLEAE